MLCLIKKNKNEKAVQGRMNGTLKEIWESVSKQNDFFPAYNINCRTRTWICITFPRKRMGTIKISWDNMTKYSRISGKNSWSFIIDPECIYLRYHKELNYKIGHIWVPPQNSHFSLTSDWLPNDCNLASVTPDFRIYPGEMWIIIGVSA